MRYNRFNIEKLYKSGHKLIRSNFQAIRKKMSTIQECEIVMIRLNCDYLEGAHPNILSRLMTTNYDQTIPYGFDEITKSAKDKIKKACNCENGEVFFLVGGTQTNATMLDFILGKGEGVIAADTGHISVHEAGAVEYCGHKVITIPEVNGKLVPEKVKEYLKSFYEDPTWFHMACPGAIYISHPSEYGTLYSAEELAEAVSPAVPLYRPMSLIIRHFFLRQSRIIKHFTKKKSNSDGSFLILPSATLYQLR